MTIPIDQARLAPVPSAPRDLAGSAGPASMSATEGAREGGRAEAAPPLTLVVSPALVTRLLLAIVAGLSVAGFTVVTAAYGLQSRLVPEDGRLRKLFDLDSEVNLPTWYQGSLLVLCAAVLLLIGASHWRQRRDRPRAAAPWLLLGITFLYLSFDELVSAHELTMQPLRAALGIGGGILYYAWVVPGAAILLALGLAFIPFLRGLAPDTRTRFLVAGALYVGGAFGLELVGGAVAGARGEAAYSVKVIATVEETLEMVAIVLFFRALLLYIAGAATAIVVTHPTPEPTA